MVGYREGYSEGYDDGYEKGIERGIEEGKRMGQGSIEFIRIRCRCGCTIPYQIIKSESSITSRIPDCEKRTCPDCMYLYQQPTS